VKSPDDDDDDDIKKQKKVKSESDTNDYQFSCLYSVPIFFIPVLYFYVPD